MTALPPGPGANTLAQLLQLAPTIPTYTGPAGGGMPRGLESVNVPQNTNPFASLLNLLGGNGQQQGGLASLLQKLKQQMGQPNGTGVTPPEDYGFGAGQQGGPSTITMPQQTSTLQPLDD